MMDFQSLRQDYRDEPLDEASVLVDPFAQFQHWMREAVIAGLREPNAMSLATATPAGRPSVRTVLLKGVDAQGFVFYTNYDSQKGRELAVNPEAELLFFWTDLERQVRIHGTVHAVSREESEAYFLSRPPAARIGAAASKQSAVLGSRSELEARIAELREQYPEGDVPLPTTWGGYRLVPQSFEFWQGRASRLHDRIFYESTAEAWEISRLSP
ncbi:MAG: pyridoxamine 5'-phosphate oxidase [Bryobacterales bacterium]|nr:pyridoxamine 5'-phosphate oxidase [Bryobacterales bacterium]